MLKTPLLLAVLAYAACGPTPSAPSDPATTASIDADAEATACPAPAPVGVGNMGASHCGAQLIADDVVLVAAACVAGQPAHSFIARFGADDADPDSVMGCVDLKSRGDHALLRLAQPVDVAPTPIDPADFSAEDVAWIEEWTGPTPPPCG